MEAAILNIINRPIKFESPVKKNTNFLQNTVKPI